MSAVASKPRSAKKYAAPVVPSKASRLEEVLDALQTVDEKLEAVYDAVVPSSSLEVLLDLIAHNLLVEAVQPLRGTDLTEGSVAATYGALFIPLAALEAAIALADGTAIQHALIDAHRLLDWAQTQLDSANPIARSLPDGSTAAQRPLRAAVASEDPDLGTLEGALGRARILTDMAKDLCQWQVDDEDASRQAQERISVLLTGVSGEVAAMIAEVEHA